MIELTQELGVKLGLVLTPNIDLSLKILTMNVVELEEKIKEFVTENPLVELEDDTDEVDTPPPSFEDGKLKELDEFFKERFSQDEHVDLLEATVANRETLQKSLERQALLELDLNEEEKEIALFIIYNLDEKGFLDVSVGEIAKRFAATEERVNSIRRKIMMLEPLGCGSLGVVEFLGLQAEAYVSEHADTIKRFVELIYSSNRPNLKKIRDKLSIDDGEFRHLVDIVSGFSLYPLESYFPQEDGLYIEPDVYVRKLGDEYVAILNERALFNLKINEELFNEYLKYSGAKEFAEKKYREARQFLLAITQRNKTLLKTVNVILKKQRSFFENGVLMPLTRRDIAEELNYNVSTITRAVSNKYLEFEGKVIPLGRLFSFGVGDNISKDFIKKRIKAIIDDEDKCNPLNDDVIKLLLEKEGIKVTRRTITKYRREMNIPNSRERRCQSI